MIKRKRENNNSTKFRKKLKIKFPHISLTYFILPVENSLFQKKKYLQKYLKGIVNSINVRLVMY